MLVYSFSGMNYKNISQSKLAQKIFCLRPYSAAVVRAFRSAGVIVSQRKSNISPMMVNGIILIRSAVTYLKDYL
jgi:hypothetical protein